MAVETQWQEREKIILITYSGSVAPNELTSPIQTVSNHLDKATHQTHIIVDWRQATDYPHFADFMFPGLKLIRHPRMGWLVLVGESSTLKLWVDLFSGLSEFRYKIFPTLESATDFLQHVLM